MNCMRKDCKNKANVLPALRCKDTLGGNVMFAMAVPHCDQHTHDAVIDAIMTAPAWAQLCRMIRKEGLVPPEKAIPLDFIPLGKFSAAQLGCLFVG